jgi:ATP-dependent Zn protease
VLFIDEMDALGSSRSGRGGGGGTEEHDQTLNQLLAMMDGIASRPGVLVIGATNRLSALDSALTRPGRFDRILQLPLPDEAARQAILAVHCRRTKLAEPAARVLPAIARATPHFSGADLAHVVNEAAILAVRGQEEAVSAVHLEQAVREFKEQRNSSRATGATSHGATSHGQGGPGDAEQQEAMERQLRMWASLLQGLGPDRQTEATSAMGGGGSRVEENE